MYNFQYRLFLTWFVHFSFQVDTGSELYKSLTGDTNFRMLYKYVRKNIVIVISPLDQSHGRSNEPSIFAWME